MFMALIRYFPFIKKQDYGNLCVSFELPFIYRLSGLTHLNLHMPGEDKTMFVLVNKYIT
jgi:hypothetical protein